MAFKTGMLLAIVILVMVYNTRCEMDKDTVTRIEKGIGSGEKAVELVSKFFDKKGTKKAFKSLEKMTAFLGAAGGLISFALAFLPKADSAELKYMKEKFAEVNRKLDKITTELDNINSLITYDTQRALYAEPASKILHGHKQLLLFLDELQKTPCEDKKSCERERVAIASRYVNDFKIKPDFYKILNGAIKQKSTFTEPLLDLTRKTFKCDVGKIDHLANNILMLSFKAQQLILAHEKLTGSKFSITQSMNDWLKSMYVLRKVTYSTKQPCFDHIYNYMMADINDKKYQHGVSSNNEANQKAKKFMEEKYKWLGWVVYSYQAKPEDNNVKNVYGKFTNIPANKDDRKRILVVSSTDKHGTYSGQKYLVLKALDTIFKNLLSKESFLAFYESSVLVRKIEEEMKKEQVWKFVTSLNVLKKHHNLDIKADNALTYISEQYIVSKSNNPSKVRVVVILKSMEQANGLSCDKSCKNEGECRMLPYSSLRYCVCKLYFEGDKCEEHSKTKLAKSMDSLLETTFKLPKLSDIAYDIKDLREFVGVSLGEVQTAVSQLEVTFKKAFDKLSIQLTTHFQWSNLMTHYSSAIRQIEFYSHRFQQLPKLQPKTREIEGKKLAAAVLAANGIAKWLFEINYLLLGRTGTPLVNHESLMLVFMNRYRTSACRPEYKAAVDNTWRQVMLLQQTGYFLWAQALDIMGRPTEHVAELYAKRTSAQVSTITNKTCEYDIAKSVNVQCSGGRYIHPTMTITNQCKDNYYTTGAKQTTCVKKSSGCNACNCNAAGSNGMKCADHSGQCSCKPRFYGSKCENRDCVWRGWSAFSSCTKGCDYGGSMTRRRWHDVTKQGQGRSCDGSNTETRNCFNGCCNHQFHCTRRHKCIPSGQKCNYDNNCGDKQDETGCQEECDHKTRHTDWHTYGGGSMVYFDRHTIDCGGDGKVLKMFKLGRSNDLIRFEYKCCTLFKNRCKNEEHKTGFSYDGEGNTVYLDRQEVYCGDDGYLSGFRLERNGNHDHVRYVFQCCKLDHGIRSRTKCETYLTNYSDDGGGKSDFLDRQTVSCPGEREFLTLFKLERNSGHGGLWRYKYRCCKIEV